MVELRRDDLVAGAPVARDRAREREVERGRVRAEDHLVGVRPEELRGRDARRVDDAVAHLRGHERAAEVRVRRLQVDRDRLDHRVGHLRAGRPVEEGERIAERGELLAHALDRRRAGSHRRARVPRVRPVRVLQCAAVRLRPLTEAECYARCYGARDERVSVLHDLSDSTRPGRRRRVAAAQAGRAAPGRAGRRRPRRPHEARMPKLDVAPPLRPAREGPPGGAAAERVGVHGDVARRVCHAVGRVAEPASDVPDVLAPDLRCVFCGINPGRVSAAAAAHFANPRNDFWRLLHDARLHAAALRPAGAVRAARARLRRDERRVPHDARLGRPAARRLRRRAARAGSRTSCGRARSRSSARRPTAARSASAPELGPQLRALGDTALYVLPSTSPANAAVPYAERLHWFRALHEWLEPVERRAVRALVRRRARARAADALAVRRRGDVWWITPGGGVDAGRERRARRCAASSRRRRACGPPSSARSSGAREHVLPFAAPHRPPARDASASSASSRARDRADDRPRRRERARPSLVDARRARVDRRADRRRARLAAHLRTLLRDGPPGRAVDVGV